MREPKGLNIKSQPNYKTIIKDDYPLWFHAFKNFGEIEFFGSGEFTPTIGEAKAITSKKSVNYL